MLNVLRHLDLPEQERVEDGEKMVEIGLFSRRKPTNGVRALAPFYAPSQPEFPRISFHALG